MTITEAAVIESAGAPFTVQEVDLGAPQPHEILVRMTAAGICHTDLTIAAGFIPFPLPGVLGHEGTGVVEEVGSAVTRVVPGDKVVLTFTSCGHCTSCRTAHPAYCTTWIPQNLIGGKRVDGTSALSRDGRTLGARFFGQSSFARHAIVDERSTVKIEGEVAPELLAPLGCSIQTGAGAVWNTLRPEPGSTIAVLGVGMVGLAAVMAAALMPVSKIIAVGRRKDALSVAEKFGATDVIDTTETDLADGLRDLTGGAGIDNVVECIGNPDLLRSSIDGMAPRGSVAVVGAPPYGVDVALDVHRLLPGRRVLGVCEGDSDPEKLIPLLAQLVRTGRMPIQSLVREYAFDDIQTAVDDFTSGAAIKAVLRFDA